MTTQHNTTQHNTTHKITRALALATLIVGALYQGQALGGWGIPVISVYGFTDNGNGTYTLGPRGSSLVYLEGGLNKGTHIMKIGTRSVQAKDCKATAVDIQGGNVWYLTCSKK